MPSMEKFILPIERKPIMSGKYRRKIMHIDNMDIFLQLISIPDYRYITHSRYSEIQKEKKLYKNSLYNHHIVLL